MNDGIYVSIKPDPIDKIVQGIKDHEFRNYVPKEGFKFLYVYVPAPKSELRYVIEIGKIVKYPNKLEKNGDGNKEFNKGKKSKFAYPILKVYELVNPIPLKELKETFSFVPPLAFSYSKTFPELTDYIEKAQKVVIIGE